MAKYLVIVESPAKMKTIGRFLGRDYKVEASVGHVRDLPKSQIGVDVEHNFEPKYITIRGKGDVITKLKKEAKTAQKIFLATDPDREGEAISWHLATILNINEKDSCRITFNEITPNAVKNAIKNPRPLNMNLVDAQQARRVLDRIVGYKISPLLWKKVRKGLSAGRVQSVATRLVCDREEDIENFIPKEYWHINAKLAKGKSLFQARFNGKGNEKIELTNKEQVEEILKGLYGSKYSVSKIKKGEKKRTPAPPFITSTLQQEAARKLNFTTKRTMMVAQNLYEGIDIKGTGSVGLITYMRTDSTRISDDAKKEAVDYITNKYGENYLPKEPRIYKNKSASQDAHEAIRPSHLEYTPEMIKDSLSSEQFKLYKLIWERFVASQMASALYDTVTVDIKAGVYTFKSAGSTLKFNGFMTLYIEGRDDDSDDEESSIPELIEGEELTFKKLESEQHFTQPPSRYTEATLVKAMEEKGIGRPSTYAPTITTILARGYIEKEKKTILPTELGRIVTDLLKNYFKDIVDEKFTAQMEDKLDEVEEGSKDWVEIMKNFYSPFIEVLKAAEDSIGHVEIPDEVSDVLCEKCGRNMVIKTGRFGKFLACPGFPNCRNAKPIIEESGALCPLCQSKILVKKSKKGKKYFGCEKNPTCSFMTWDTPVEDPCPNCGKLMFKKFTGRKATIYCSDTACGFKKED
jgi:DNA topoisomerase-1